MEAVIQKETKISAKASPKHSHLLFYIGMATLLGVVFLRNVFGIGVPVWGILLIAASVALVSNRDEMVALVATCIPLATAFQYKYLIAGCLVLYLIKFGREIRLTLTVLPLSFMMIWELVHGIGYDFSLYEYFRNFSELLWCALLMMSTHKKADYALIVRTLSITTLCTAIILFINLMAEANFDFTAVFDGTYRFGKGNEEFAENYAIDYNANQLGFIINLSVAGLLQLISARKQRKTDYLMLVPLFLFGVLTMSRSFLICFAMLLFLFVFSGKTTFSTKFKRCICVLLLILFLVFLVQQIMPDVVQGFLKRFQEDDVSNGRTDLFGFYNDFIFSDWKHWIFGIGLQNLAEKVAAIVGYSIGVCHNGTQELVVVWGLPGLFLFGWFLLEMLLRKKPKGKRGLVQFIPFILLMVNCQAGQLITYGSALLSLSVIFMSLQWNGGEENGNLEENRNVRSVSAKGHC